LQRTNQLAAAAEVLERARRARPFFSNTYITLARVLRGQGRFTEALALAADLPQDDAEKLAWQRPELVGSIHRQRAIVAWDAGDEEQLRDLAGQAAGEFRIAAELAPRNQRSSLQRAQEFALCIAEDRFHETVPIQLRVLGREPDDAYEIANLASLLPREDMDAASIDQLRRWLRALASTLARDDATFVARQRELQQQGR
jgi:hypothetical protein